MIRSKGVVRKQGGYHFWSRSYPGALGVEAHRGTFGVGAHT